MFQSAVGWERKKRNNQVKSSRIPSQNDSANPGLLNSTQWLGGNDDKSTPSVACSPVESWTTKERNETSHLFSVNRARLDAGEGMLWVSMYCSSSRMGYRNGLADEEC